MLSSTRPSPLTPLRCRFHRSPHRLSPNWRSHQRWLALPLVAVLCTPAAAEAANYGQLFSSAYVWRGITVTDGAVFQPTLSVSGDRGLSANVWGNLDLADANQLAGDFNEIDLTVSYGWGERFSYEVGMIEYLFPNGFGEGTREVFATLAWGGVLEPSLSFYYDFDEVDDYYLTLAVAYARDLSSTWSASLGVLAAVAGEDFAALYAGGTSGGLFNGELRLDLAWSHDKWSLGVAAAYTDSLDRAVLPEQPVGLYGGVSFSYRF